MGIGTESDAGEARLRQLVRAEAAVADLGRRALLGAEPAELLQAGAETADEMLGLDLAAVFELEPDRDELRVAAVHGFDPDVVGSVIPGGTESLAGFTIVENGPVMVADLATEDRFSPEELLVSYGVRSGLAAPLRARPRPLGVLAAYSLEPRELGEDDVNLLRSAANVLAAAIGRARIEDSLRQANSLLHGLVEGSADVVFVKDLEGRYMLVNSAGATTMGRSASDVVGRTTAEIYGEDTAVTLERHDLEVIAEGRPFTFEETIPVDGSERIFLSAKSPYFDGRGKVAGIIGIARDITERKRAEERQRFLAQASAVLDTSLDPSRTLQTIANLAVPGVADLCVIDLMEDDGALHGVAVAALEQGIGDRLIELRSRFPIDPHGNHPVAQVLRAADTQLFPELETHYAEIAQSDEHFAFARDVGYRSAVVAPLTARGRTLGAISLIRYRTAERYGDDEVELVRDLGRRAAMALDNARLYAHEHDVSETLQRSLLPERFPEFPGLRFAARYVPGGPGVGVGGDWYDALDLPGGCVGLAMGDVAGRGLRAASIMGQLRTTVRVCTADESSPGAALVEIDRLFQRFEPGEMATLLLLSADPATGSVTYAAAAHPPPLVVGPDGDVTYLEDGRGLPLGVAPAPRYEEGRSRLPAGATLLLYTDGLIERPGESIDAGLARLSEVASAAPSDANLLVDYVLREMLGDAVRPDDVALLAVHVVPVATELDIRLPGPRGDLSSLREQLRVWLGRQDVPRTHAEEVILACSEAAANAMEHAYGSREGPVQVLGRRDDDRVTMSVRDSGTWRPPRESERGRGLGVIDAMMDSVEIVKGSDGTEVRLVRRLSGGK
ncbi:MAG: SpoIIE family protein phosphatase [Gaiellaceae bacterium]